MTKAIKAAAAVGEPAVLVEWAEMARGWREGQELGSLRECLIPAPAETKVRTWWEQMEQIEKVAFLSLSLYRYRQVQIWEWYLGIQDATQAKNGKRKAALAKAEAIRVLCGGRAAEKTTAARKKASRDFEQRVGFAKR